MEDTKILELFWNRDESAIQAADEKYRGLCWGIALNLLTNREDAEECVNDTWLTAWTCIPPKRPVKLSAFLARITRSLSIDRLRKKYAAKRPEGHMADIAGEIEALDNAVDMLAEHMEAQELTEILNDFLSGLTARDRDLFIRRYWFADPLKDIAKRHGTSTGAVKQSLLRSRRKLRSILEREGRVWK